MTSGENNSCDDFVDFVLEQIESHITVVRQSKQNLGQLQRIFEVCCEALLENGKIIFFGNGGSAADAQHLAAELVGRFKLERKGIAAISLATDTSAITAIGNDYGMEFVFSRQLEAIANPRDVAFAISTSGNSQNVLQALRLAKKMHLRTAAFTGNDGGELSSIVDNIVIIPSSHTARIQEVHILFGHILCETIEQQLMEATF